MRKNDSTDSLKQLAESALGKRQDGIARSLEKELTQQVARVLEQGLDARNKHFIEEATLLLQSHSNALSNKAGLQRGVAGDREAKMEEAVIVRPPREVEDAKREFNQGSYLDSNEFAKSALKAIDLTGKSPIALLYEICSLSNQLIKFEFTEHRSPLALNQMYLPLT